MQAAYYEPSLYDDGSKRRELTDKAEELVLKDIQNVMDVLEVYQQTGHRLRESERAIDGASDSGPERCTQRRHMFISRWENWVINS